MAQGKGDPVSSNHLNSAMSNKETKIEVYCSYLTLSIINPILTNLEDSETKELVFYSYIQQIMILMMIKLELYGFILLLFSFLLCREQMKLQYAGLNQ